jgi:hypothetical protein
VVLPINSDVICEMTIVSTWLIISILADQTNRMSINNCRGAKEATLE